MRGRMIIGTVVVALFGAFLSVVPGCTDAGRQNLYLTILHTNDIHGHLLPFTYPDPVDSTSTINRLSAIKDIGGLARCATLAQRIESEVDGNCLLLDAGDIMDGTPFSLHYKGIADIKTLNAVGYDAMVIGNHEFNMSYEEVWEMIETAEFPLLCANTRMMREDDPEFQPNMIIERGGLDVGIFGLTTRSSGGYPACRDRIEILDMVETAERQIEELEAAGADLIIALTHLGFSGDETLAESVSGIDVIVGGHSHTRLERPRVVKRGEPEEPDFHETLIVQAFQWAGEMGRLDLTIERDSDGSCRVISHHGELIPVTADIAEDPAVAQVVSKLYEPMRPIYDIEIAKAKEDFVNSGFERATVNLVADATREVTGADLAMQNYGGVRASILKGPVRMWEMAEMLPFENKIVVLDLTGERILDELSSGSQYYSFSGLTVLYEEGNDRPISATIKGEELEDDQLYSVATIDYLSNRYFSDIEGVRETGMLQRDAVADYIREKGEISPVLDGRTRIVEDVAD